MSNFVLLGHCRCHLRIDGGSGMDYSHGRLPLVCSGPHLKRTGPTMLCRGVRKCLFLVSRCLGKERRKEKNMSVFELKGTITYEWTAEKNTLRVIPHYEHTTRDGAFAVAVEKGAPSNARLIALSDSSFEIPLPKGNKNVSEENKNILIQAALSQKSVLFKLELESDANGNGKVKSLVGFQFPVP